MTSRRNLLLCLAAAALAPGSALASGHAKKKGGGARFTQFPTITVFTSAGSGRHGTMSVEVGVYAADDKMSEQIKLYLPRLQDAYVTRLQAYASGLNNRSLTDTDYMSGQLQTATDKILGHIGAKVLLGSVLLN